jgi:NAD(P)-dependent dehydrogenase (short-subunit alcohol dehydrogenase family)
MALRSLYTQLYPPAPPLTGKNLLSQKGKVFIVTGSNAGIGFELVKILYAAGARVYMAARSRSRADAALSEVRSSTTYPAGEVRFLELDLDDLESVKKAVNTFNKLENRLYVLWNNTGVAQVPDGSKSKQGYERKYTPLTPI